MTASYTDAQMAAVLEVLSEYEPTPYQVGCLAADLPGEYHGATSTEEHRLSAMALSLRPVAGGFAEEALTHAGWAVFCDRDHYGTARDRWFAIHQDTGEERRVCISALRAYDAALLRRFEVIRLLAEMGFPQRTGFYTPDEIVALHARCKAGAA